MFREAPLEGMREPERPGREENAGNPHVMHRLGKRPRWHVCPAPEEAIKMDANRFLPNRQIQECGENANERTHGGCDKPSGTSEVPPDMHEPQQPKGQREQKAGLVVRDEREERRQGRPWGLEVEQEERERHPEERREGLPVHREEPVEERRGKKPHEERRAPTSHRARTPGGDREKADENDGNQIPDPADEPVRGNPELHQDRREEEEPERMS